MRIKTTTIMFKLASLLGLGAALGACWGGRPLKASLKAHQHDACAYGAAVVDELHALGFAEAEIWTAAGAAVELLTDSTPTEAGVAAAADFTGAPVAASTP